VNRPENVAFISNFTASKSEEEAVEMRDRFDKLVKERNLTFLAPLGAEMGTEEDDQSLMSKSPTQPTTPAKKRISLGELGVKLFSKSKSDKPSKEGKSSD